MSITPRLIRNIQRKEPAAESFWSGTEATLRSRPLLLRNQDAKPGAKVAPVVLASAVPSKVETQPAAPGAPAVLWEGPEKAQVGQEIKLFLNIDSVDLLRAASLQIGYNPAEFEFISIEDGGYFGKSGRGVFSKTIDAVSGRISVGLSGDDAKVKGAGKILVLTLKPKNGTVQGDISLIATTLIGAEKAIRSPALPLVHRLVVSP